MKFGHDTGEYEESGHDAGEDREIRARCLRTKNKTKGSNPGAMSKNSKQNEGTKSGCDGGKPETKQRD